MLLGLLGVIIFSLTLPATRAAVSFFDPYFVAAGRAVTAGLLAALVLLVARVPAPERKDFPALAVTALGVVFGFPYFTTWAMQFVPAIHGAVVLALLPLATALAGALVAHERPSTGFWIMALLGSSVVVVFALYKGGGTLHAANLALAAAVATAGLGYAQGATLSARLGGWQTISWALVISLPVNLVVCAIIIPHNLSQAPLPAWLGFVYVSVFSMYVGFFPWYKGLALGGIARVGQVQLLQPFFTFIGAALLLGESIDAATLGFAVLVVALVAAGRKMPVRRKYG
jgi:drug/metabolite transporter (DMT)-like permease